jgi:6-phosphogluconolactonase
MMAVTHWKTFDSDAELAQLATARILSAAREAIAARGVFHLVLAGGSTPRRVYQALRHAGADWAHWCIWFGDERCLPPDHPERNSRMAGEVWLDHVAIPAAQVHVMPAELGSFAAAQAYAGALSETGDFDLVLLGLGEDGHTASLFPGHDLGEAVDAPDALAVSDAPKPPPERVSLSARRLSRSQRTLFLITGAGKRDAVIAWQNGQAIPASRISALHSLEVFLAV